MTIEPKQSKTIIIVVGLFMMIIGYLLYSDIKREYIEPPLSTEIPTKVTEALDSQFTSIDTKLNELLANRDTVVQEIIKYKTRFRDRIYSIKPTQDPDSLIQSLTKLSEEQ